ncbi:hypothetical protein [uncultured Shimia sp.]|uniref:hypothetical protein n=1 Tax=uncultured Shimia sp. TaxID=573152 RepID=UPI0026377208|nr:hypothetical protein [uncultured Shimia sp.]
MTIRDQILAALDPFVALGLPVNVGVVDLSGSRVEVVAQIGPLTVLSGRIPATSQAVDDLLARQGWMLAALYRLQGGPRSPTSLQTNVPPYLTPVA